MARREGAAHGPRWERPIGVLATLAVLAFGLVVTTVGARIERDRHAEEVDNVVGIVSEDVRSQVQTLLTEQVQLSEVTAAMLAVDPDLDRDGFRRYFDGLDSRRDDLLGLGYIRRVPATQLDAFVQAARADGAPTFPLVDPQGRDEVAVILYNEPAELLRSAWGFDLLSVPGAADGLARATDAGGPVISDRLVLAVDMDLPADQQPAAYVLYAPVFDPTLPTSTAEERQAAVVGWSNLPFRAQELLDRVRLPDGVGVVLDDGEPGGPVATRGDLTAAEARELPIEVLGRQWTVSVVPGAAFTAGVNDRSGEMFRRGTVITLVLAGLVALLATGSRRWRRAADRATASLAASEQRLRATVAGAPDLILVLRPDGTIESASDRACDLLGHEPASLVGRPVGELLPALVETADRPPAGELRARRADGTDVPVEVALSPLRADDPDSTVIAIIRDVTARAEAQRALAEYAAELERSNRDLEEFASIASHDLSEPLRVVGGYVDLVAHRYPEGAALDAAGRHYLDRVVAGVERMQALIEALLEVSRLRADTMRLGPVDLGDVTDAALANLETIVRDAGAVVRVGPMPRVWGDREQLTQVVQNLVSNAIKFRDPSRPLEVDITAALVGDHWAVSVRDNGIGIPVAQHDRIFAMFRRLHSADAYEGTGIGLAVCRRVLDLHGGEISVDSEAGVGSTFTFTLRARPSDVDVSSAPHDAAAPDTATPDAAAPATVAGQ